MLKYLYISHHYKNMKNKMEKNKNIDILLGFRKLFFNIFIKVVCLFYIIYSLFISNFYYLFLLIFLFLKEMLFSSANLFNLTKELFLYSFFFFLLLLFVKKKKCRFFCLFFLFVIVNKLKVLYIVKYCFL